MKQNKKIAVTGGIGSGKTEVCRLLRDMGYAVFSCDDISRALWQDEGYRKGLAALFPNCTMDGEIDKYLLSSLVFSDGETLEKLNNYAHPLIMERLLSEMEGKKLAFAEVPLLFEGGYEGLFDGVIAVRRPKETRIEATKARDGLSEAEVTARMVSQFDPSRYGEKNCHILENNGSLADLSNSVKRILGKL